MSAERIIQKYYDGLKPLNNHSNLFPKKIACGASIFTGGSANPFQLAPGAGWGCNNIWTMGNNAGFVRPDYFNAWYGGGGCCEPELTGWGKLMVGMQLVGGPGNLLSLAGGIISGIGKAVGSLFGFDGNNKDGESGGGFFAKLGTAFGFGGGDKTQTTTQTAQTSFGAQTTSGAQKYVPQPDSSDVPVPSNATLVKPMVQKSVKQDNPATVEAKTTTEAQSFEDKAKSLEPAIQALRDYQTAVETNKDVDKAEKNLDTELNKIDDQAMELNKEVEEAYKNKTEAEKEYESAAKEAGKEAKEQLAKAANARKEKEKALRDAKNDVSEAETSLATAKSNLAAAGADIKPEEKAVLEKAVKDAEAKLKEAQEKVKIVEKEVSEAKEAEDKAAKAVNGSDKKLQELYQKVKDATDKYEDVKSKQEAIASQSSEIWSKKIQINITKLANEK